MIICSSTDKKLVMQIHPIGVLFGCFARKSRRRFLVSLVVPLHLPGPFVFALKEHLLWMDEILHHFEATGKHLFVGSYRESDHSRASWVEREADFATIHTMKSPPFPPPPAAGRFFFASGAVRQGPRGAQRPHVLRRCRGAPRAEGVGWSQRV